MVEDYLERLNIDEIKKHHKELETFEDYIPLILHNYISSYTRFQYLKNKNLFDKINKMSFEKRKEFKKAKDKNSWIIEDVTAWVDKYEEFKDFIK